MEKVSIVDFQAVYRDLRDRWERDKLPTQIEDIRIRAVVAGMLKGDGLKFAEAAAMMGVSKATYYNYLNRDRLEFSDAVMSQSLSEYAGTILAESEHLYYEAMNIKEDCTRCWGDGWVTKDEVQIECRKCKGKKYRYRKDLKLAHEIVCKRDERLQRLGVMPEKRVEEEYGRDTIEQLRQIIIRGLTKHSIQITDLKPQD